MFKASTGLSIEEDAHGAGVEAALQAIKGLSGARPQILFVFATSKLDQEALLQGVNSVADGPLIVGASTAGEISQDGPMTRHSVVVMALASDTAHFFAGIGTGIKEDAGKAGRDAANALKTAAGGDEIKLVITINDVLAGNGSEVIRGMQEVFGQHFPIVGGSAGDDAAYKQTYQYLGNKVFSGAAICIGLTGDFKYSVGVNHGWIPVGTSMRVTKSEGSVIHELDGQPAINIYESYLGPENTAEMKNKVLAEISVSYPLGMQIKDNDELLLRAPFFVDDKGSITCGGEVPEGTDVRLMIGSKEDAVIAASNAAKHAQEQLGGDPQAILVFSCHVRDKLFVTKERAKEEIDAIKDVLSHQTPLIGFYTYAEQAPLGGEVRNIEKCNSALHNETVVVLVLGT